MPSLKVLVLGGTGEACALAEALVTAGHRPLTSLAGVTRDPRRPAGEVRSGSLGGVAGLVNLLNDERFDVLIDATHPFATGISANAYEAGRIAGLPHLRLERPAWVPEAGDRWTFVASVTEAVQVLPTRSHVLLTTGRKDLAAFMAREDITGIARMIEPPGVPLREGWEVSLSRPPHPQREEVALMQTHHVTQLVSKNAGGDATKSKLLAARQLSLPVIMVQRPVKPAVKIFATAQEICRQLQQPFCA